MNKKFINWWLVLMIEARDGLCHMLLTGIKKLSYFSLFQIADIALHPQDALLSPPQRGCPWLPKLKLPPSITSHLTYFLQRKHRYLKTAFFIYVFIYLLSHVRDATTSSLTTVSPHLECQWIFPEWMLKSAQLRCNYRKSHTCKKKIGTEWNNPF